MFVRSLSKLLLSLSVFASASAFAAPLVFNVNGVQSVGALDSTGNTVVNLNVGANAHITSFDYDVNLTAFDPSYLSEISLFFSNSSRSEGVYFNASSDDNPGTASYAESFDLVGLGFDFVVGADGILRLEFYEDFNDADVAVDGIWNFGTLTFGVEGVEPPITDVPEPTSILLLGAGLAAMGYAGRRRRRAAM
jgi:hypothetical protein